MAAATNLRRSFHQWDDVARNGGYRGPFWIITFVMTNLVGTKCSHRTRHHKEKERRHDLFDRHRTGEPRRRNQADPPEKARELTGAKLIVGDVREEKALRDALKGQDAVISALGTAASPFREVSLLSTVTRSLVNAMKAENVSRLVCITGIGAGDSDGHGGFLFDEVIFPLLLKNVYADKNRQEALVRNSGLDWVLVRPSVLSDKPGGHTIRPLTDLSSFLRRNDIAGRRRELRIGPSA